MANPKKIAGGVVNFGVLAAFTAFASFPFAWMLITMFKQTRDLLDPSHNPFIYPSPPTLEHLRVDPDDECSATQIGSWNDERYSHSWRKDKGRSDRIIRRTLMFLH